MPKKNPMLAKLEAKLDERLRAIVGEDNFKPFEVRYGHDKNP